MARWGTQIVNIGTVCAYPKFAPVRQRGPNLGTATRKKPMRRTVCQEGTSGQGRPTASSTATTRSSSRAPVRNRATISIRGLARDSALIRKCSEAVDAGRDRIEVWGDGSATRDFLYVDDAVEAILLAAERYDDAEPVNIGSGREPSIATLVGRIAEFSGFRGSLVWDGSKPNGQPRRRLDVSRARERFGCRAETDFDDGLRRTGSGPHDPSGVRTCLSAAAS